MYPMEEYDVAVIGAGHAGIEAAMAAARLGCKTVLFTLTLDGIANMPCNPSIGGTAKGHLVREIDALGGQMGIAADVTFLQSRMLNRGKGPAVHSLRVQSDRAQYHLYMKRLVENQPGLDVKQAEIVDILRTDGRASAVVTRLGGVYPVKAAILCCGTYLEGKIHVGEVSYPGGPDAVSPAVGLSESLRQMGLPLRRFKTGTPARVHRDSIDFDKLERQQGDEIICPFSFSTTKPLVNRVDCYIAYTNEETHRVILENLHRSPLYSGRIEGVGPRYCPSIEDKVVRFADKKRHQLFIEPMGLDTEEYYLQGMSSSLPEDVQIRFLRTIKGLERVRLMRTAYAIEYDCIDPLALTPALECKAVPGLFGAGQFNGTSGYEEAAAQGLMAGINAARKVQGKKPVVLSRSDGYIGALIDDLVTKGCRDPYRMMTSRSEYRLLLRQDNADERLMPIGHEIGLVSDETLHRMEEKYRLVAAEEKRLQKLTISPDPALNRLLEERGSAPLTQAVRAAELIRRPQIGYRDLLPYDENRPDLPAEVAEQVEIRIRYAGYIARQLRQVEQMKRLEGKKIPPDFDYHAVTGLRLEAIEKLSAVRPEHIGQAAGISGVSPADISVLLVALQEGGT